ncbi:hypothetical protein H257_18031 [Aphanomyces astaci]|uniref:subtilisin n=1 Tax=Aphanomyces astaci TaxID=112090 RepID=W4FCE8_APHAT|nr:hypothetical protein H257_18031 [Aphanomyces astaci]ETV65167.1 hypothetical protein H257_18031 [Aphanomyces astaci]|eukprot:XP_009845341.1 hypothetical protein H257_18031 [Aphanomyces astaci]
MGVKMIQAPALWANDIKGEGIVVANIDSGQVNCVQRVQGHVQSRMVVECAQLLLCPHDKKNCDSSKAPHVINGSFGKHRRDFWLEDIITMWREAGIIPVFANGNNGREGCAYSSYPAASPQVIAVGSTNSSDFLEIDSSLGPSVRKRSKPDISAPGVRIRSAASFCDDVFLPRSGSSYAAPHVAGAIALYLSANKGASYYQVNNALTENVDTDTLTPPNKTCGGIPNTKYPNNLFGYGRLNIFKAMAPGIPGLTLPPPTNSTQALNPTIELTTCGILDDNTHYVGGDFASTNQVTAESCCAECKKTPGCKLFVWYTLEGGMCRLKGTQGQKVAVEGAKAGSATSPSLGTTAVVLDQLFPSSTNSPTIV